MSAPAPRTALVLSGGGARGAYEVGVLRYVREALAKALGAQPRFDIVSGTSIGAVNACFLAATSDVPDAQAARLASVWLSLRLEKVFRWSALGFRGFAGYLFRRLRALRGRTAGWRLSDLVAAELLGRVVHERIDWARLHDNVRRGAIEALTVTATDLGTGRSVVFIESARELPDWSRDPLVEVRAARIGAEHALASAAIPLLFPPVRIDGSWFTDGSLRQTTPLAPAIRLGADRVLVIALRPEVPTRTPASLPSDASPSTASQLGRVLSALLLDRTDYDLDRMRRLNRVLAQGERAFGAGFARRLADLSAEMGAPLRPIRDLVIRPSVDLSDVARAHATYRVRGLRPGTLAARFLARAAADAESVDGAADLASYLLFDREYAGELMALGYHDAAKQRDALIAFFESPAGAGARSA
jgi:NTE family protein